MALDIFSQARAMQDQKNQDSATPEAPTPPMLSQGPDQGSVANPQEQDAQKLSDILTKPTGPQQSEQDVLNAVSKTGVSSKDLPVSNVGKNILTSRLKNMYGDSYKSMPEAVSALNLFDQHINKYSDIAGQNDESMLSHANMTLGFLKQYGNSDDDQ